MKRRTGKITPMLSATPAEPAPRTGMALVEGSFASILATTTVRYIHLFSAGGSEPLWTSTLADTTQIVPFDCTLNNFRVKINKPPGAGKSWTFAVMKNGAATAMSVAIADSATSGVYAGSVSLVAGDKLSLRCTPAGTPASASTAMWTLDVDPAYGREYSFFSMHTWGPWNYNTYAGLPAGYTVEVFTPEEAYSVMPMPGTLKWLRVNVDIAPGAGKSWAWKIYKNGSDTGLTVTISNTDTTGSNLVDEVSVMPGDLVCLHIVGTGSPAYHNVGEIAVAFVAEVPGWYPAIYQADYLPYSDDYNGLRGGGASPGSWTEVPQYANACRVRGMTAWLKNAPAAGEQWTAELYKNQAATGLKAIFNAGEKLKTVDGLVDVAAGDELATRWTDNPHSSTDGPNACAYIIDASE